MGVLCFIFLLLQLLFIVHAGPAYSRPTAVSEGPESRGLAPQPTLRPDDSLVDIANSELKERQYYGDICGYASGNVRKGTPNSKVHGLLLTKLPSRVTSYLRCGNGMRREQLPWCYGVLSGRLSSVLSACNGMCRLCVSRELWLCLYGQRCCWKMVRPLHCSDSHLPSFACHHQLTNQ